MDRLETGLGTGKQTVIGRSHLLRSVYTDYEYEDFVLRLARRDNHSISIHLMWKDRVVDSFADKEIQFMSSKQRARQLQENVTSNERGDLLIDGIPMFRQGNTPFCGIHSLAMVGYYYGLRMHAEDLIAGADLQNTGSAKGSNVFGIYHAAAEELGMSATVSSRFDARKVQKSLEAGMPVIIWRRVSMEREYAHTQFAKRVSRDEMLTLSEPSPAEQSSWPDREKKGSPSHASVVSGINPDLKELIITEPWGEHARKRHMRFEEMEATAYAVFYFEL
ncbi:MAG: C39 family peptidase [Verrucomicrobiota bacterium]